MLRFQRQSVKKMLTLNFRVIYIIYPLPTSSNEPLIFAIYMVLFTIQPTQIGAVWKFSFCYLQLLCQKTLYISLLNSCMFNRQNSSVNISRLFFAQRYIFVLGWCSEALIYILEALQNKLDAISSFPVHQIHTDC